MANGETTTPATTPDRIESSSVKFDPSVVGDTPEEKKQFLYERLFGEYSESIKLPQDITVDQFKEFLKQDWKFQIKDNPPLAAELNALAPEVIEAYGEELYWKVVWAGKTVTPDEDAEPRKHYTRGGQSSEKGAVGTAADPVNLFNGNFSYSTQDFMIDGAGIVFSFTRSYSQQASYNGPLGFKWDHNYNLWIRVAADQQHLTLSEGDLQLHHFRRHELHDYFVPPDGKCAVIFPANNSFELREPDGNRIIFQPHDLYHPTIHVASRVEDKFGNYLRFQYADGLLSQVEINLPGRTVSFFYDSLFRITRIQDFTGRAWGYAYDDIGDLSAVSTPPTAEYKRGLHTRYLYSSYLFSDTAAQHNLTAIVDADGRTYLENDYGTDQGLLNYNRVIRQRQGGSEMLFDYADVVEEFDFPYSDAERPAHQTLVTESDGRQTRYLFNKAGNTILMETYARIDGIPKIVSTHYRYNRDGNLAGVISPLGRITQYLYGRDHYERLRPRGNDYSYANDADLTAAVRLQFNNLLAVVRRMKYYTFQDLSLSGGLWSSDIFPDIYATASEDIIHKFVYEDEFSQIIASSDPRFTASADPSLNESADYHLHLTRYTYAPGNGHAHLTLTSVTLPRPLLPDGNDAAEVVTHFTHYDEKGRLLRTVGPGGLEVLNEYYTNQDGLLEGFQKSITSDPGGLAIRFEVERDALGRATRQYRPKFFAFRDERYFSTVEFNDLNQVTRTVCTAPFSINQTFSYNRTGNQQRSLTELKDKNHVLTGLWEEANRYDEQFHLIRQVQGDSATGQTRVSKAVFDGAGRPYISLTHSGYKEKYTYNERGLKARAIVDYGGGIHAVATFRYDADGRLVSGTDANGNTTRCRYDAAGRLIEEEDALGNRTITHYDKCGNATLHLVFEKVSDDAFLLLFRKEFQYDALKRPVVERISKFETASAVTEGQLHASFIADSPGELLTREYYYSASGQLYEFRDFGGQVYRSEFDVLGRQTAAIDPMGNEIRYAYDEENNVIRIDRREVTWNEDHTQIIKEQHFAQGNRYDELNRLVEETNSLGSKASYAYDSRGNLLQLSGPLNSVSENAYDIFNRLVTKTEHLHNHEAGETPVLLHTVFAYNAGDQVVRQTDPMGRVTQFVYDTMGRLLSTILPDNSADLITYDKCGNVVQIRCRNNVIKRYRYNSQHRPVQCQIDASDIAPGDAIEGAVLYKTTYDALGRAIRQENDFCRIENNYNSLGWNVRETTAYRDIPGLLDETFTIHREFNVTDGLTRLRYPSGRTIAFERDALDRITAMRQVHKGNLYPGNAATPDSFPIASLRYEGLRKRALVRGNGCRTEIDYDFGGRIMQVVHAMGADTLLDCRYLYDALGNLRNKGEVTANAAQVQQYVFDSLSRLRRVQSSVTGATLDLSHLGPSPHPIPAAIPAFQGVIDQRMVSGNAGTDTEYAYDHMGNRLSVSASTGTESYEPLANDQYQAVNGQPLQYDANGNIKEDAQFGYRYDHNNQLCRIADKSTGAVVQLFYDPLGRNCAQRSAAETRAMVYNGYQLIEEYLGGALVSSVVFDPGQDIPVLRSRDNREFFYCGDLGHSTRLVMEGSQPVAFYGYDPFGNPLQAVTQPNEFLFNGKRLLPGIARYDFLFRTYDPAMGRFMQRDPAGFIDGPNLYAYAGNNPLSYADRAGLERRELWLGKEIGADFASPDIDIHDPSLGMDDLSIYYFDEHGTFLRWNERTSSWVEDYTGVNVIIEKAPELKRSWLERYLNGVKRGVMAPVHLAKDTAAKVVDMGTQGFAVLGKVTGGWDTGYTTWSSTSKAVEAGVSQKELLWQATGGLVVNPLIAVGDVIFTQNPEALGEMVGGAMIGGAYKYFKASGEAGGAMARGSLGNVIPKGKKFKYTIDGETYMVTRYPKVKSKITRARTDVKMYQKSLKNNWEYARYNDSYGQRTVTDQHPHSVYVPPATRNVVHTHPDGIALPSQTDMQALLHYPVGTTEAVLGRAFPHADAVLRNLGLPESGLVMKTTYSR